MAALGYRTFDEMIGQMRCSTSASWSSTGRPRASISQAVPQAGRAGRRAIWNCEPPEPWPRQGARPQADREAQAGARPRRAGPIERDPQRQPHRRRDAVGRGGQALRPRRPAGRHDPRQAHRHRRPELRRLAGARRHPRSRRRRQRLCRQGPVGRPHHRAPAGRRAASCRKIDHRRQHRALRRDRGRRLLPRRRRRALRGAQLRRRRGGRRRRRSLLRIHDRRRRGGARATGRNFAAGMSGGIAYVLDEDGASSALQHGDGRARAGAGRRKTTRAAPGQRSISADGAHHGRHGWASTPSACASCDRATRAAHRSRARRMLETGRPLRRRSAR